MRSVAVRKAGTRKSGALKLTAVLALALSACSSANAGNGATRAVGAADPSTTLEAPTTSTTVDATTTTTAAPDTTTTTTAAAAQKSVTASLPQVMALQQRLADLGYDVGTPDGQWGARTTYSLIAFQKVEGLTRDGTDGPETEAALAKASKPGPMVPDGAPTRIEIDVARQVLFFWQNGSLARILPVSTGSGEHYCVDGACDTALTPGGTFRIGRKAVGLEVSPLGELWWPMYFNGGIAIHGSPSIPPYPASHGCIRIPMYAAPTFYDQVGAGTVVNVLHSPEAAAPPDQGKAVPNAVAPPDTAPTTVAPTPVPEATTTTTTTATTTTLAPEATTTTTTTPAVIPTLPPTTP